MGDILTPSGPDVKSYEQNNSFQNLQEALKKRIYFPPQEDIDLFMPYKEALESRDSISGSEAKSMLDKLSNPPFILFGRSSEVKKAMLSWFIRKLDPNAPDSLKEKLRKLYLAAHDSANAEEKKAKDVLKKHKLDTKYLKESKKTAAADPLNDYPIGLPLDPYFFEGTAYGDGFLPVGPKYKPYIPEYFRKLYKNADAIQNMMIRILAKNVYNPVVEWHKNIKNDRVKAVLYKVLILPFQALFTKLIKRLNAKKLRRDALKYKKSVGEWTEHIYSAFYNSILGLIKRASGNKQIPGSMNELMKKMYLTGKEGSDKEFRASLKPLLEIVGGVLDIAGRDTKKMSRLRAKNRPDCFFQNKLYLLILMQHKGKKGINKYVIEFMAQVISNLNGDKELRARFSSLKEPLSYLCLSTPLGVKLAEMAGLKERWNRVSGAERKKLLSIIFDILLPSKSLTKEQLKKGKHINKAMLSFRKMYNRFMQQNVENMPFKKKRGEMLLGINMLLDNIRIQLVSASTDKKSLDKKLDSLVSMIRIFNKTLTNQEKASIKKSNPYFARIIDNPESIKIFINGIKSIPKKAQNAAEFVSETSYAIKNSNEVKVLKRKIKYTKAKLTRLVSNYTTAVKRGVKSKAEKLKSQIHQNKKQLVYLALQLDKFDKTSSKLRNLTEMIRTESDSKKLDSLLKMFTETVLQGVPDKFKKAVSIDAYKELIKKPPKKILTKTQKICDKLMENNILSKICKAKIPYGRQFLFKSITLNEVLKKSPDKAGVKKIIFDAALKSLQGTDYIDKFRTMVGSTEFIDDKQKANRNLLNKLISKYVKRYI